MHQREAPAISIQTEQKAACGFVCPAPRPLPRPRPPWQGENVWEGARSRALNREGDQLAVPAARPARRPARARLFISSHLLPVRPRRSLGPRLPRLAPGRLASPLQRARRSSAGWGRRTGPQETVLLVWFPRSMRASFCSLSRARCAGGTASLKRRFTASCFPCSAFPERQPIKTPNKY